MTPKPLLGHISFGVRSIESSKTFYSATLAPLSLHLVFESKDVLGYGLNGDEEILNIFLLTEESHTPSNGFHLAFNAPTRDAVDAFHAAAVTNGGSSNGEAGLREHYGKNYYAAFVIDPDGWKLEAVCKNPE